MQNRNSSLQGRVVIGRRLVCALYSALLVVLTTATKARNTIAKTLLKLRRAASHASLSLASGGSRSAAFLGTLAQITATFLAVIVAGTLAYVIFLQERAAQFDEKIAQRRVEIRADLLKLPAEWSQWSFLPSKFCDVYHSHYPKSARIDLTKQAATDLLFSQPQLGATLAEVQADDSFGGPYTGRVYLWILNQAVARLMADLIPAHGDETFDVFPATATALGFAEWRSDFLQIYGMTYFLRAEHERLLSDFMLFLDGAKQARPQLAQVIGSVRNDIESLYRRIAGIRASVDYIDSQMYLSTPYRLTERFRWRWLVVLLSVVLLIGIIAPMLLMRSQRLPLVLGGLTIACFAVVLIIFWNGMDATSRLNRGDYIRARWYTPLTYLLKRQESGISNRDLLDTALLWDALNRPERHQLPAALIARLEEYLEATRKYNQAVESLGAEILARMRRDSTLSGLVGRPRGSGGGLAPNLLTVTNPELRRTIAKKLAAEPATQISFQTPRRDRTLVLRTHLSGQEISTLLAALERIGAEVSETREFKEFGQIVRQASGSLVALRSTLEPLLH